MNAIVFPPLSFWASLGGAAVLLAVFHIAGCMLVPAAVASRRTLPGLAAAWTSGMIFITGVSATLALQRASYLAAVPLIQIALAVFWRSRLKTPAAGIDAASEPWNAQEAIKAGLVVAGFVLLFSIPFWHEAADGRLRGPHADMGYYAQQVIGIPESGAASLWSGALGPQCETAGEARDVWYHWGPIMLAIGVRSVAELPAFAALLGVVRFALDGMLIVAAGAAASTVCGGVSRVRSLVLGGLALMAVEFLKMHGLQSWLRSSAPDLTDHHVRYALAVFFSYKQEGVIVLAALAAWLSGKNSLAGLLVFASAVSAPHSFAGLGCAAGGAMIAGLLMRKAGIWRPCMAATMLLILGMATAVLSGATMPAASEQKLFVLDVSQIGRIAAGGFRDVLVALAVSAVMLPGIIHLLRAKADGGGRLRLLGLVILCGLAASWVAYHLLPVMADRVHMVLFVQTMLVMPIGWLATIRFFQASSGFKRHAALGCATAAIAMGAHDLVLPAITEESQPWKRSDLKIIRAALGGQPFGYFAERDRGWWIPMQASLASLMDVRCIRLNPRPEHREQSSVFYGFDAPLRLTRPRPDEDEIKWSVRFARDLGIRHVISTPRNPIPKSLKPECRAVAAVPSMVLYELPEPGSQEARPLAQPALKTTGPTSTPSHD